MGRGKGKPGEFWGKTGENRAKAKVTRVAQSGTARDEPKSQNLTPKIDRGPKRRGRSGTPGKRGGNGGKSRILGGLGMANFGWEWGKGAQRGFEENSGILGKKMGILG